MTDFMERRGGLMLGMPALSGGIDHAYTYGYWMNCLDRDESKRVILGFYGSLAYGMTRETYAAVEYGSIKDGCNPDTLPDLYSNTQQLRLCGTCCARAKRTFAHRASDSSSLAGTRQASQGGKCPHGLWQD